MNRLKNQSALAAVIGVCVSLAIAIPADLPKWNGTGVDAYNAVRAQLANVPKVTA
jgi:hypothetical protein